MPVPLTLAAYRVVVPEQGNIRAGLPCPGSLTVTQVPSAALRRKIGPDPGPEADDDEPVRAAGDAAGLRGEVAVREPPARATEGARVE